MLEAAIMHGKTVLLEDVDSALDPSLDNLFTKSIYVEDGIEKMNFGDHDVNYDRNFNFFLSTKLANPHYLPEICIKLAIVNFTVTPMGLQD
jgi:dynein heavy chain